VNGTHVAEHDVAQRLHRRHDERAPRRGEPRQQRLLSQQVLDLGRHVERHRRELLVERAGHVHGVPRPVQEIRVAERHVRGAGLDLLADVRQHDVLRDDEEPAAVDRRDGAVAAKVLAAPARLDVRHELEAIAAGEPRVLLQ
jgi:hypothetical protein